jgi:predicted permease
LAIAVLTTPVPKRRGVIAQCIFRSNYAIIGMPLAAALGGPKAEAVAAVLSSVAVPILNVLAVISLSMFVNQTDSGRISVKHILLDIVKNPLIQGVGAGLLCLVLRWGQIEAWGEVRVSLAIHGKVFYTVLTYLKAITTPLALIVLGGQFVFAAVKELRKEIIVATLSRVLLAPIIGIGGAIVLSKLSILQCGTMEYPALVALFASPVSVSSAIMASQMHNDEQLATQLVVWTTIASGITVFLISCGLMAAGFIAT